METEKLYWGDAFATRFTAEALELAAFPAAERGGATSVVLARSLFFPEGGGQLGDRGTLRVAGARGEATVTVLDTQIDDDGVIHHLVGDEGARLLASVFGEAFAKGARYDATIEGEIDGVRRADHRAHHTAQHMVSRALVDIARADTVSARLGAGECTIDADAATLGDAALARVEDLVNAVVRDDVLVHARFPTAEELASMPLRRAPKVATGVRVIEVLGFDLTPCGGTHVTRSGQIGFVRITRTERYKGKTRVFFQAAQRAVDGARAHERALAALARDLSCGPLDVDASVARLRADLKARGDALGRTRAELVGLLAEGAVAASIDEGAVRVVPIDHPGFDLATLRALAGRVARAPHVVALCASAEREGDADVAVVVQRGPESSFDCGAWLKAEGARRGGRGGGSKERAEGRFPAGTLVRELAKSLRMPEPGEALRSAGVPPAIADADGKRPADG